MPASVASTPSDKPANPGASVLPDPSNPGFYFPTSSGQLIEDPLNPGFYLIGE